MKRSIVSGVMTLSGLAVATVTHAQGILSDDLAVNIAAETGLGSESPVTVTTNIISVFLGILAVVAVALIVYGGFSWMTSAGNTEKVDKAKKILTAAIIGLAIVMAAWGITLYVFGIVLDATNA